MSDGTIQLPCGWTACRLETPEEIERAIMEIDEALRTRSCLDNPEFQWHRHGESVSFHLLQSEDGQSHVVLVASPPLSRDSSMENTTFQIVTPIGIDVSLGACAQAMTELELLTCSDA